MGINDIILYIMMIFMIIAALDRVVFTGWGKSIGLYDKFEEGFNAMGALSLSMVSVICIAPVLAAYLEPVIAPVYKALGANPAMFATTLLACDMGGYPLAMQLAGPENVEIGRFAGIILGAMMGPTIVFSIPVALGIIRAEDRVFLARGILIGIVTIPLGCFVGGLIQGLPVMVIVMNLIPVIIVAAAIAVGLAVIPATMIKIFDIFGRFVVICITLALAAVIVETLTGVNFITHTAADGTVTTMAPISEAMATIGAIAIVLAGAFPLVYVLTKFGQKPLEAAGRTMGMNDIAAAGLVATLANNIPMFTMMKDMDDRGKVINVAFTVSAAFTLGDHLGFTAGVERGMIAAMVVGKLVGGISAVLLALLVLSKDKAKTEETI